MINRLMYFFQDFWAYLIVGIVAIIITTVIIYRKPSNIILSLITSAAFLILLFIGGEAYLRYVFDQSDGIGFLRVNQKWHNRHVIFNGNFRRDKEFTTNKRDTEIRIAAIGDSITFGIGIENPSNRFTNLTEQNLKNEGYDVSIYNLGISGVDTNEEIGGFHSMSYLDFDMVIWQYYLNDANISNQSANAQILINKRQEFESNPLLQLLTRNSYLLDFMYWRFSSIYDKTFADLAAEDLHFYQDPEKLSIHKNTINNFVQELKTKKIPVIVAIFPLLQTDTIRERSQAEYDLVKSIFIEASPTAIIDLSAAYKPYSTKNLKASKFDHHPSELAHRIAAELLYKELNLLIQ